MSPREITAVDDDATFLSDEEEGAEVRLYECAVLYVHGLAQKDEAALIKEVEGYFDEAGATLTMKDAWGRRGLAYPIKGAKEANIIIYYYEMDPLKLKEVDTALRITKNLMRQMIIKPVKHYKIEKWGAKYEEWLKTRESVEQQRVREREVKLQEKVVAKAKQKAQRVTEKQKVVDEKPQLTEEQLSQEIEKLITDDTLNL